MKVYYKSSNRIKNIVNAEQILPSNTTTNAFPNDAATVVLSKTKTQFPSFSIYLRGKDKTAFIAWRKTLYTYPSYITRVDLSYFDGQYLTSFYGGGVPLDKLSETMQLVKDIKDSVINNTRLNP